MIYVASRASIPERAAMWRRLRQAGVPINSTWIDQDGEGDSNYGTLWPTIIEEIRACTALILYVELGDLPLKGAFVEVGAALALGKRVYCVAPGVRIEWRTCRPIGSWMHHPNVVRCESVGVALLAIDYKEKQ